MSKPITETTPTEPRELYLAAEEIDAVYPKRVGSPSARLQWIMAAIKRDGVNAVRSGTVAFASACKAAGLCRRHEDWGSVPYPQKYFGKKYAYYMGPPEDQLCISNNRVVKTVQPGISTAPESAAKRRECELINERERALNKQAHAELKKAVSWFEGLPDSKRNDWVRAFKEAGGGYAGAFQVWKYMRKRSGGRKHDV